jgi:hypothetical protein
MIMRMTDPIPRLNLDLPEAQAALARIKLELEQIHREEPAWPPLQRLQEARARAAPAVVAALDAMDGWRTREGRLRARY